MSGGKAASGSKDYYGHVAGIICQGQIDFIWGLMVNNELVWPKAKIWDSQIYKKGRTFIYTDGNVYKASDKTQIDPPAFPWVLLAIPWTAGTYNNGDVRLYMGNVWEAVSTTSVAPPATVSTTVPLAVQSETPINGWVYVCTPDTWVAGSGTATFWEADSIVAWKGRLYKTPSDTNAEPPNAPWVLFKQDLTAGPNPFKFTVEGHGDAYLYRGTATETLDTVNEAILSALGHPPYRNCAVLMLKNFLFGTMQTNPQDTIVLAGRNVVQSLIVDNSAVVGVDATAMDDDWNVNPMTFIAEFLTHPIIGLGLPLSLFNAASWQAQADFFAQDPQRYYISPMINSLQKVRQLVADVLGYPDAFVFWSTVAQLVAGHWPHGEAAPAFTAGTTIDRNDIVAELSSDSDGWDGTDSSVSVSFEDIQGGFKSRPANAPNLFNMAVTQRLKSQRYERPYITRFDQASAWASEMAKISGDQMSKGTISVRAEKADSIEPGSLFLLTDDEMQTSEVQRCTRKVISAPPAGVVKITHETERGVSPTPYAPTAPDPVANQGPSPGAILNAAIVQLPSALGGAANRIACLAARDNDYTSGLELWFQQADGVAYQSLGKTSGFSVAGVLKSSSTAISQYILTSNLALGSTFNVPAGTIALNVVITYIPPGGSSLLGSLTYGTDYTADIINGTITIPNTTHIPVGSTVIATLSDGALATSNAVVGNTYQIPKGFWNYNVWTRASGAAYTGGLSGSTHRTEGTDYTIDPVNGEITILAGGGISATDVVFVFYNHSLRVTFSGATPDSDLDNILSPLTQDEINDNELLVFAFQAADFTKFEIMSASAITASVSTYPAVAGGVYTIQVARQQYGTKFGGDGAHNWTTNDAIFVVKRSALTAFSHLSFEGFALAGETASFILAPESAWVSADISDIYDTATNPDGLATKLNYTFGEFFVPTVTWIQEQKNGTDVTDWTVSFLTTDVFTLAFQINSPSGANIINASLIANIGQTQQTLWANNFEPSTQQNAAVQFSLGAGTWQLFLNVLCDDGSSTSYPLTLINDTTPQTIQVNTPATTYAWTPVVYSYDLKDGYVKNLYFGKTPTGTSVYYQIQPIGTAYNPAGWSAALPTAGSGGFLRGPVPNFKKNTKTLYAYSSKAGVTDSPVASWNF